MASLKISKRSVDAAPVPATTDAYFWDTDDRGFGLRVTPKGVRSYVFQYRLKGRAARRLTIGKHGGLTPDAARTIAARHAVSVAGGVDPVEAERKRARDARTLGFEGYIDRFTDGCLKEEWPDSWEGAKRLLEIHALPHLRGKAMPEIEPDDIKDVIDLLRPRKPIARKVWAVLSRMFSWAVEERDITKSANPMEGVRPPPSPDPRKRVLSPDELLAAWRASYKLNDPFGPFVRLLIATLQRRTEVAGLPWKELKRDKALWHIDSGRAKNDEDHLAPLNALAMAELEGLGWKSRGLALTTTGETPISGFSRMKKQLDRHMLPILQELADRRAEVLGEDPHPIKPERWTLHDLRRTGTTVLQSLGVPVEHTEKLLNHHEGETSAGVRKVYNLWKYEPEKRRAVDLWGGHLERLVASADGSNVVTLAARRA